MVIGSHGYAGRRHGALLVGGVLAVALGLGCVVVAAGPAQSRAGAPTVTVTPAVDPRLIVVPRAAPLQGTLSGGVRLRGTLFPAIPGPNIVRLQIVDGAGARVGGGRPRLVVTMPGMRMRPITAALRGRGAGYSGVLPLPMFGRYRATVVAGRAGRRYSGALTLTLSLPAVTTSR